VVGALPEHAEHQRRKERRGGQRERGADQEQDVTRFQRGGVRATRATTSSRPLEMARRRTVDAFGSIIL